MVVFQFALHIHYLIQFLQVDDEYHISAYIIGQLEVFVISIEVKLKTPLDVDLTKLAIGWVPLVSVAHLDILLFLVFSHYHNRAIIRVEIQHQDLEV